MMHRTGHGPDRPQGRSTKTELTTARGDAQAAPRCPRSGPAATLATAIVAAAAIAAAAAVESMAGPAAAADRARSALEAQLPKAPLPEIETFMQIGANGRPTLSPDGRTLYFLSGASGTSQVYRLLANGWPYQITFLDEGVDYISFNPEATHAVVLVDVGGNENYQFQLLDARTGQIRPLTDKPGVRHTGGVWHPDGRTLYYSANEPDPSAFHIYELDLVTGRSKRIVERPGSNGIVDVSPDGGRAIFYSATTSLDSNLYLLDLRTGASRLITPHEGERSYRGGVFAADGRHAYVMTDDNPDDVMRLARIRLDGPELRFVLTNGSPWEVETFAISENRRFLAWIMNEDGYGRMHLQDLQAEREIPVPRLDGIVDNPVPVDSGYLAFTYNSPTRTADVWIWDFREAAGLASGEPPPWRGRPWERQGPIEIGRASDPPREKNAWGRAGAPRTAAQIPPVESWLFEEPAPGYGAGREDNPVQVTFASYAGIDPDIFTEPELVRYRSFDGTQIPAFLYMPPGWDGKPVPILIEAHGGPTGQFRPYFNRHFQYLMLHGFGILAPNFRGSTGYGRAFEDADNYRNRLDSVKDVAAGAQWLIDKRYTRKGMIGIKGASYGGYMTLAAMTEYPDLFAAGIDQVGIANFETFLERTADYRRSLRESEYGPLEDREFLRSISPIHKADRIEGALLVVHGENDPRVPVSEARQILKAAASHGTPVDSLIFPDEGHGIAKRSNRLVFYRKMVEFFEKHLK